MNAKFRIVSLATTAIALAVGTFAVTVRTDFDHHVDFSRYKTYSWAKVDTPDPLWNDRVKEAVDRALRAKGGQRFLPVETYPLLLLELLTTNPPCGLFMTGLTVGSGKDSGTQLRTSSITPWAHLSWICSTQVARNLFGEDR